jgi:cysteine synthase A
VEPEGCQPLAGLPVTKPRHLVQGTSYGSVPPHWDASLMDLALSVTDDEVECWRRLLFGGGQCLRLLRAAGIGAVTARRSFVATVLCDTDLKY